MNTNKLSLKLYAEPSTLPPSHDFLRVWHDWIKRGALAELLVDVVDYGHVHEGPHILLVGHESDYALHFSEGRPGLYYQRKRAPETDEASALADSLTRLYRTASQLEVDLPGLRFLSGEVLVSFLDRLNHPNDEAGFDAAAPLVREAAKRIYGAEFTVKRNVGDPREALSIRMTAPGAPTSSEIFARLTAS